MNTQQGVWKSWYYWRKAPPQYHHRQNLCAPECELDQLDTDGLGGVSGIQYRAWNGRGWNFFLIYSLLALACIGLGVMVSAIVKDTMLATDIGLFYTSPAFVFSGYTFPKWGMPWYDQFYAQLLPYSWFLDGFIKISTMSLPLRYALPEISALLLFIGISYPVAILVLQRQCNKILGV